MCKACLALAAAAALAGAGASAAAELGDPTRPTPLGTEQETVRAATAPRWQLQSTLVADTRRLAVINGKTVSQGGAIEGATLVEVRPDGVTLEHDGRSIRLRLLRDMLDIKRAGH